MSTHNLCFEQKYLCFLYENFQFLEMKFSIYLNRRVFVMKVFYISEKLHPDLMYTKGTGGQKTFFHTKGTGGQKTFFIQILCILKVLEARKHFSSRYYVY